MKGNITSLCDYKKDNEPHASGQCKCMACGNEWAGIVSLPHACDLECPECGLMRGAFKYPLHLSEGRVVFQCNCGCEHFVIEPDGAMCISCGGKTRLEDL